MARSNSLLRSVAYCKRYNLDIDLVTQLLRYLLLLLFLYRFKEKVVGAGEKDNISKSWPMDKVHNKPLVLVSTHH